MKEFKTELNIKIKVTVNEDEFGNVTVFTQNECKEEISLAEQMIQLSGKNLDEIKIIYTGLRPGEKLHEELFHETEKLIKTKHNKILQAQFRKWEWNELADILNQLFKACDTLDEELLITLLSKLVPEYKPS